jgi:small subunit ribosomal protein S6
MSKNKYEGVIALNTTGHEDKVDELVQLVGKEIEGQGAQLEEIDQLGRRDFSFNARHLASGHYVNYIFKAEPSALEKVRAALKLNDAVHLQHFQRLAD